MRKIILFIILGVILVVYAMTRPSSPLPMEELTITYGEPVKPSPTEAATYLMLSTIIEE